MIRLWDVLSHEQMTSSSDIQTHDVVCRLDDVTPGAVLAVLRGSDAVTREWVAEAQRRGAVALLLDRQLPELEISQCVVADVRTTFGLLCAALAGAAALNLPVAAVTGTNGKTTTAWLIRWMMNSRQRKCGLLGTIEYDDGEVSEPASLTTPDARSLWRWLSRMQNNGCAAVALELSSHALCQHRAAGLKLNSAIITNVTHDHLDYHGTFDDYWSSKVRILDYLRSDGLAVVNLDDVGSLRMKSRLPSQARCCTISLERSANLAASQIALKADGTRFRLDSDWGSRDVHLPMAGRHNVSNLLGAVAAAVDLGLTLDDCLTALTTFTGVPGRLERIDCRLPFSVFVDYAHTDDALAHCLQTLREFTAGRVIGVFGAGGDRDRSKRLKLGNVAAKFADVAIVTSDNPRSENPQKIIDEICSGDLKNSRTARSIPDREEAIGTALMLAAPGDCVVIAGKGHEQVQVIGDRQVPFDDRDVARRCLDDIARSAASPLRKSA